ncbi:MAG TPA: stage IV sporulation protein A [Oscillospiraceae bacterium]|nr:stage IV sporulation protein A [Oscillospiraceae bacterium]HPF56899.1 stage IV sporulation protein A [Clostridiales bacterium]HPK36307.1 stage IV sporulation protein A [Oscillospiraceae bacterium]HPR76079.1 stage IV sporulation protein A [Oscillospiraceae bacterium]
MGSSIYTDMARRTGGDIYIGVVGPVRTGKSTFIKRFMETLVVPNIIDPARKERATDELPQAAAGRTIMTTEPKFIPEEAVKVRIDDDGEFKVRMIDCVGYIVPSSIGYIENEAPRMVMTPWFDKEVPFNMAAEVGTKKVITEHSTIGLVVTTDGSISDIPRAEYAEAEQRVINELREINKPFAIVLNSTDPSSERALAVKAEIEQQYGISVISVNCMTMNEEEILEILRSVLYEFPLREIWVDVPNWLMKLPADFWLKTELLSTMKETAKAVTKIKELDAFPLVVAENEHIKKAEIVGRDYGNGSAKVEVGLQPTLFFRVMSEITGQQINDEGTLFEFIKAASEVKSTYDKYRNAIEEVNATGYGIVMPTMDELSLDPPEIMKQSGRYGVRLKAGAPSIHMIRADISTEIRPVVGSEKQSEELVMYLLQDYEESPEKIWQSNIFGKSLHELVNEGLHSKLTHMPPQARVKLQDTVQKIINDGCNGLICIIF